VREIIETIEDGPTEQCVQEEKSMKEWRHRDEADGLMNRYENYPETMNMNHRTIFSKNLPRGMAAGRRANIGMMDLVKKK
jgi:hypothetical protein